MPKIDNAEYLPKINLEYRSSLEADIHNNVKCFFTLDLEFNDVPNFNIGDKVFVNNIYQPNVDRFLFCTSFKTYDEMKVFLQKIGLTINHTNVWWIL